MGLSERKEISSPEVGFYLARTGSSGETRDKMTKAGSGALKRVRETSFRFLPLFILSKRFVWTSLRVGERTFGKGVLAQLLLLRFVDGFSPALLFSYNSFVVQAGRKPGLELPF